MCPTQQTAHVIQADARRTVVANQVKPFDMRRAIAPIVVALPLRGLQQALPLVEPNVLRGGARQARKFADPHPGDLVDCLTPIPDCTECSVQPPPSAL